MKRHVLKRYRGPVEIRETAFLCEACGAQGLSRREMVAHVCPQMDLFEPVKKEKKPEKKPGLSAWLFW